MKRCTKCEKDKDESEFYKNDVYNTPDGLSWSCKECVTNTSLKSYNTRKKNIGDITRKNKKEYDSNTRRQRTYNLTNQELDRLLEQKVCEICGKTNKDGKLFVDHNHTTNKVRGMLCTYCNSGLGMFKDNEELLLNAITYLKSRN